MSIKPPWSLKTPLGVLGPAPKIFELEADEASRQRIARLLDLAELRSLTARVGLTAWFDGVQVDGSWRAEVVQSCGVTLEPLESAPSGDFIVRAVPASSVHAAAEEDEVEVDLEADDPPDILVDDTVDIAAYVVEHLALEIDPFPRKPGVEFEPPKPQEELSPFAVLRRLQDKDRE
ncbi:DUF177 domain-containing protein [soil metagenome]